jgi:hypothetical protein
MPKILRPKRHAILFSMHLSDIVLLRLPLGIWTGATLLSALAAPVIFASVPSRDLAGAVFGGVLKRLEAVKHVLSLLLVLGVFAAVSREGRIDGRSAVTAIGIFLAVASNVYLSMVVRPRMEYFRRQAGSFDEVPEGEPWRLKFRRLHSRSARIAAAGLACSAVALAFSP